MSSIIQYPRIVFLGTPDFAVASLNALIEHNYNVVAVVTAPDKPAGRGMRLKESAVKTYATSKNIPVLQPEKLKDPQFIETLASYKADVQIVVAFRMLPEIVWNMPSMGTINVHGSLLPNYRGAAPINWAIMNGEQATGVTTFRLKHAIDTGDILLQSSIPILPEDNMGTMYYKLMDLGAALLIQTIDGLLNNSLIPQAQILTEEQKHAPKIFKEDCQINWKRNALEIHNQIRGLAPIPTAFTYINNKSLKIFASSYELHVIDKEPGSPETDGKTYLRFACNDGWIYVQDVQLEGKKKMDIASFLRGFQLT